MPSDLDLKIVVAGPPTGYAFCLQRGKGAKAERLDYVEAADDDIPFDLTVTLRQGKQPAMPDFGGPFVQGPPGGRFFYLCVGRCSLIAEPHWNRPGEGAAQSDRLAAGTASDERRRSAGSALRRFPSGWPTGACERQAVGRRLDRGVAA